MTLYLASVLDHETNFHFESDIIVRKEKEELLEFVEAMQQRKKKVEGC